MVANYTCTVTTNYTSIITSKYTTTKQGTSYSFLYYVFWFDFLAMLTTVNNECKWVKFIHFNQPFTISHMPIPYDIYLCIKKLLLVNNIKHTGQYPYQWQKLPASRQNTGWKFFFQTSSYTALWMGLNESCFLLKALIIIDSTDPLHSGLSVCHCFLPVPQL
jgi:hypothetical protein